MRFLNLTRQIEIGSNSYLLEAGGKRLVLDSGLHPKKEGDEAMPDFGLLDDGPVDAIFLSHAHHDHLGTLPVLMRRHPDAPVFMTEATSIVSDIMLHNSVNVMTKRRDAEDIPNYPLFTHREVERLTKRWRRCPLHQRFSIEGDRLRANEEEDVTFELYDAGHIIGSSGVLIRAEGRTVFYTGDVNFEDQTLSQGARFPQEHLDVLIIETTRGDHPTPEGFTRQSEEARLAAAINAVFEREGAVLMPVFALGKTQEILAMLAGMRRQGRLPHVPISIGGLGMKLTEVYDRLAHSVPRKQPHLKLLEEVAPYVVGGSPDPAIKSRRIFAISSGMMTEKTLSNGLAHRFLPHEKHAVFFVGYCDPDSPAGKLLTTIPDDLFTPDPERQPERVRCEIEQFNFSAHASRETLLRYIEQVRPKKVVLVHGEVASVDWFRGIIPTVLPDTEVIVPVPGEIFDL